MDGFKQARFKAGLNTAASLGSGPQHNQTCFKAESILSMDDFRDGRFKAGLVSSGVGFKLG